MNRYKQAGRQAGRQTGRQAGRQTGTQADRQAGRQADRQEGFRVLDLGLLESDAAPLDCLDDILLGCSAFFALSSVGSASFFVVFMAFVSCVLVRASVYSSILIRG
jgi:hypothetical protein